MKPVPIIRSDKPHTVKVTTGSHVASRTTIQNFKSPEPTEDISSSPRKKAQVKTPKAKPTASPAAAAKTVRAKSARDKTPKSPPLEAPSKRAKNQAKPAPVKKARPQPKPSTAALLPTSAQAPIPNVAPTPSEPVWEQNSLVKTRIDQLKARNALLAEQLQRLPQTPTARGKRP